MRASTKAHEALSATTKAVVSFITGNYRDVDSDEARPVWRGTNCLHNTFVAMAGRSSAPSTGVSFSLAGRNEQGRRAQARVALFEEEEEDDDDEGEDDDEDKDDEEDDSDADSDSLDPDARKQLERESRKEHKKGVKAANRERRKTKMPKAEKKKKMKKTGRKK